MAVDFPRRARDYLGSAQIWAIRGQVMALKHLATAVLCVGLFCGGLAIGFVEGSYFGEAVIGINGGFIAVDSLNGLQNQNIPRVKGQLEGDVEVGLIAGVVLEQNPNWARVGFILKSVNGERLKIYVDKMRQHRESNAWQLDGGKCAPGCVAAVQ